MARPFLLVAHFFVLLLGITSQAFFFPPSLPPSPPPPVASRRQLQGQPRPVQWPIYAAPPATWDDEENGSGGSMGSGSSSSDGSDSLSSSSSSSSSSSTVPLEVLKGSTTTHIVVNSEGIRQGPPLVPSDNDNALADSSSLPPMFTNEEREFVEARLDRMLARKIDLWAPDDIFELMPFLMKNNLFEYSMEQRLEHGKYLNGTLWVDANASTKARARLEHSRSFLLSLKYAEQQRLAREWIEGILETATESTEAMDEKIFELVEYENQALVVPVLEALDAMLRRLQEMSPDEKTLTQVVIETLKKRVEAEVRTQEMPFIRLLALLLRLETPEDRERVLRTELRNSRVIDEFAAFLEEGADYVARLRLGPYKLPENTPEEMMKILAILSSFTQRAPSSAATSSSSSSSSSPFPSSLHAVTDVEEERGSGHKDLPPPSSAEI